MLAICQSHDPEKQELVACCAGEWYLLFLQTELLLVINKISGYTGEINAVARTGHLIFSGQQEGGVRYRTGVHKIDRIGGNLVGAIADRTATTHAGAAITYPGKYERHKGGVFDCAAFQVNACIGAVQRKTTGSGVFRTGNKTQYENQQSRELPHERKFCNITTTSRIRVLPSC